MKLYSVVNMDIVGSRKIKERQQLQENLNSYIDYVNNQYHSVLVSPVTITLGDEWQLITDKLCEAYNLVHEFQQMLWKDNVDIYAGIGIGKLNTNISDDIRKMDGPCFHNARNALNIVKNTGKLKNKYTLNKRNKVFVLSDFIQNQEFDLNVLDFYYTSKTKVMQATMQEVAAASDIAGTSNKELTNKWMLEKTINLLIENNEVLKSRMTKKQNNYSIVYIQ